MTDRQTNASFLRHLIWRCQAWAAQAFFVAVRLLPFETGSNVGGFLGRTLGPHFKISHLARKNLRAAFPEKSDGDIETIVRGMWDNLGRSAFEVPHLKSHLLNTPQSPIDVVGCEHVAGLRDDDKPGLLVTGHFANWEIGPLAMKQCGLMAHAIYRAPNNPYMQPLFEHPGRGVAELIPKGPKGARKALQTLSKGGHIAMLVDQKMNDGIAVPFFGRDAMTAPALAQFVLKYDCPVVPGRIERLGSAKLRVTFLPPMSFSLSGDRAADVLAIMTQVNALLESWIRERPEQWLWLHNRWPN